MRIDHVAVAVESLTEALDAFKRVWGIEPERVERIDSERITEAMLPVGDSYLQLLEATEADSTVAKFVAKRGPGLHHIAIRVDDLEQAMQRVREGGGMLLDDQPRPGGGGHRVAFVHPRSSQGVLIELVEDHGPES